MIIDLTRTEAVAHAERLGAMYAVAFDYPEAVRRRFVQTYTGCMDDYDGARVLLARADGVAVGFAYGYTFQRGHWWPEQVGPALEAAGHAVWMQDAFELAELVVAPDHQGRGIGTTLLHRLRHTATQRRVLLATTPDNPARRLYRRLGFTELLPAFRYGQTGPAAVVMGADLQSAPGDGEPGADAQGVNRRSR